MPCRIERTPYSTLNTKKLYITKVLTIDMSDYNDMSDHFIPRAVSILDLDP